MKLEFKKIKVSRSSTSKLTVLRRRTGITPNLLCRVALCYSMEKEGFPSFDFDEDGKELNRYSLTGKWDNAFRSLLIERLSADEIDFEKAEAYLKAHLNRGISLIHTRIRSLDDFLLLLDSRQKSVLTE